MQIAERFSLVAVMLGIGICGCAPEAPQVAVSGGETNVVEIVARGLKFEAPATAPAGWTTFRFRNESPMVHFALVQKLPEGIELADQQEQVAPVFQEGMNLLNAGNSDEAMQAFGRLPAWFHEVEMFGGPGLVSGGGVAETTVYLEPGTYLIECYVKTGGVFHSFNPAPGMLGMVAQLEVSDEITPAMPPIPTLEVRLSSEAGIELRGVPTAGKHVVKVHFADQKAHENFVGHDLHLARLSAQTDLDRLQTWMDWSEKTGLETPAPVQFLGGTNELPAGGDAYVQVVFQPGEYLWIAEVPGAAAKNMALEFTVD